MFEGTGKYFLLIFLIFVIAYITKKICLYYLFKRSKINPTSALIPIYTTYVLVDELNMKKSLFYLCLIPLVNQFYYHKIYEELLKAFGQNPNDALLYVLFPMYEFPKLMFKKPKYVLDEYDLTKDFIENQNVLFETSTDKLPDKIELVNLSQKIDDYNGQAGNDIVIEPTTYEQMPGVNNVSSELKTAKEDIKMNDKQEEIPNNYNDIWETKEDVNKVSNIQTESIPTNENVFYEGDSVFTNKSLEPDKRHEKIVIAEKKEVEEKKPINPYNDGRPQLCPNCGARLSAGATTCFLCGTKLK